MTGGSTTSKARTKTNTTKSLVRAFAVFFFLLLGYGSLNAQNLDFAWAKGIGGSRTELGYSATIDASGNVYTTGTFSGTVDFDPNAGVANLTSAGINDDIFISKLDASGNFVWAKAMGGANNDVANSIAIDATGNVYTTGYFSGIADFDPNAGVANLASVGGSQDIFVSKLDASGNFVWAKAMGGTSLDLVNSIVVDATGNVYTTGFFQGVADFDPNASVANLASVGGSQDIFVSKLNANGNFVWAKAMGGTGFDVANSIAVDAIGNVYTAGYFSGTADFDPNAGVANLTSAGSQDIFVSKLDASGNFVWAKAMGGTSFDVANSIAVDASGNVYTTGFFAGTTDFDPNAGVVNLTSIANSSDIFVSKLNASGNFVWAKAMCGTDSDIANSIAVDVTGNVYTAGYFNTTADFDPNAGVVNLTSAGGYDIFVSKLDASGNFVWAKAMGGTSNDIAHSIAVDATGNVYTTGNFSNTVDFDPNAGVVNLTASGNTDVFIAKYTQCPTITISSAQTNVSCFGGNNGSATVSAVSGGTAPYTYAWSPSGGTLATASGLAAGTYVCTITATGGCTKTQSFIITQPTTALSNTFSQTNVSCNGGTNGSASVVASGGTGAYTYAWSPSGGMLATASGLIAGTYVCTITDANSCTKTQSVTITQPTAITNTFSQTNVSCFGGSNGSASVVASGGTGAYTYAWSPSGGTLATANGLAAGTYVCTITDANSCTKTQSVIITQPTAIVISPTSLIGGTVGTAYSQTVTQTGLTGTAVWSVIGILPNGLSIAPTTGIISGTPTTAGTFAFVVSVTDGTCTQTRNYSVIVACPTLVFTNTTATGATIGTAYSLNAGVTGNTATVVYSVLPILPAGLAIASTTGIISGTPTAPMASATYTVTAAQGTCSLTQGYTFAVACAGITINPATLVGGTIGTAYTQTLTQIGLSGTPAWSVSVGTLPAGITLAGASGVISGTPTTTGTSNFTISLTNGAGCTQTKTYSIVVVCPTLVFGVTTASGATVAAAYSLNAGVTGNTGTIVYSVLPTLPAGLSINTATGVISGTPTAVTPSATYVVTATQTVACFATQSYTFAVIPNCTPVVLSIAGLADAIVGTPYTHTFTVTGGSVGATYAFSTSVALPAGLSLDASTGVISGTPTLPTTITFLVTAKTPAPNNCSTTIGYNLTVRLNAITSVDNSLANLVKVSPNPSSGDFNVDFGTINMAKSSVRVYDAQGKVVFTSENNNNLMTISLDKFANGIYLMEVETSKGRILKRLAKQ